MSINIAIGSDHRGFELKNFLKSNETIGTQAIIWHDVGAYSCERSDYPLFTFQAVKLLKSGNAQVAILACASGIGMAIAANRFQGIYAGLVWNEVVAKLAKEDDNVNVLVLPADFITYRQAYSIIFAWLSAQFKGGRYAERIAMIDAVKSE